MEHGTPRSEGNRQVVFHGCPGDLSFSLGKTGKYGKAAWLTAGAVLVNNPLNLASFRPNTFYALPFQPRKQE